MFHGPASTLSRANLRVALANGMVDATVVEAFREYGQSLYTIKTTDGRHCIVQFCDSTWIRALSVGDAITIVGVYATRPDDLLMDATCDGAGNGILRFWR